MNYFLLLAADAVPVPTDRVLVSGNIVWIVGIALTGLLGILSWATLQWSKKTGAEANGTIKNIALYQLAQLAEAIVHRLNGPFTDAWKNAAVDGQITDAEAKMLASTALTQLRLAVTEDGLLQIKKLFGWGDPQLETHLQGVIEKKVAEAKALSVVAVAPNP
jgi:hypothetical protein